MQNIKPKIQNLMRLGLQAAKLAHDDLAAELIQEEGQAVLSYIDIMSKSKGTRLALRAASDFRKGQAVAHDVDQLISWTPGAGTLMLAARQIEAQEIVELWPGEDSPDIQIMF